MAGRAQVKVIRSPDIMRAAERDWQGDQPLGPGGRAARPPPARAPTTDGQPATGGIG